MDEQEAETAFQRQVEQLIEAMEKYGVAGGTIGPDGVITGMPNWEDRTKDQRFAQKVRTHGYPLGLARSTRAAETRRVAELKDKVIAMNVDDRAAFTAAFEALAYAIDAQRFLGNFNPADRRSFDKDMVDTIALNIMTWLEERGHRIAPIEGQADAQPMPDDDGMVDPGDMPWVGDGPGAAERLDQRLVSWEHTRYSRRQHEGGVRYFLFVPAKFHRQQLIASYRAELESLQGDDRVAYRASHEALAYAIDAERFLQSVPADDLTGDQEFEAINRYTNRLLAWLDDRGYEVVKRNS